MMELFQTYNLPCRIISMVFVRHKNAFKYNFYNIIPIFFSKFVSQCAHMQANEQNQLVTV